MRSFLSSAGWRADAVSVGSERYHDAGGLTRMLKVDGTTKKIEVTAVTLKK